MISGLGKHSIALKLITTLEFEILCFQWNSRLDYLKAKIKVAHTINPIDFNGRIGMKKAYYLAWNVSFLINGKFSSIIVSRFN